MPTNFSLFTYLFIFFSQLDNFFHNFNFIIYFALNYFNYRIYQISSKEKRNIILKKVSNYNFICNKYDEHNEPIGIIIHKSLVPHFMIFNRSYHQEFVTIICKKTFYDEMNAENRNREQIDLDEEYVPCKNTRTTANKITYMTKRGE